MFLEKGLNYFRLMDTGVIQHHDNLTCVCLQNIHQKPFEGMSNQLLFLSVDDMPRRIINGSEEFSSLMLPVSWNFALLSLPLALSYALVHPLTHPDRHLQIFSPDSKLAGKKPESGSMSCCSRVNVQGRIEQCRFFLTK